MSDDTGPVLADPVPLARLGHGAQTVAVEADAAARAVLARRFGLMELAAFRAQVTMRRRRDTGWIEVKGTLTARVVQECVVTLEPVSGEISAEIDELFDDDSQVGGVEVDLDPVAEEPEPIEGDSLDIGEVIAQNLSLAIDPYPRAPDADGPTGDTGDDPDGEGAGRTSPFAALALLKDRAVKNR